MISAEKVLAAELPVEAQAGAVLSAIGARAHKTILGTQGALRIATGAAGLLTAWR